MSKNSTSSCFDWVDLPVNNVQAIQTTRLSPSELHKSAPPYGDFNLGLHVGDNQDAVQANRQLLLDHLPKGGHIQWLNQVHGAEVVLVNQVSSEPVTADAAITSNSNIALAIMTADCLPILLSNNDGTEVAAIHGGWRPLASDIIANTLNKMNSQPKEISAWLGPCIGVNAFEVGEEVKKAFGTISEKLNAFFTEKANGKFLADLTGIAQFLLNQQGITNISAHKQCTYENSVRYYSYRREKITGRMASVICIK